MLPRMRPNDPTTVDAVPDDAGGLADTARHWPAVTVHVGIDADRCTCQHPPTPPGLSVEKFKPVVCMADVSTPVATAAPADDSRPSRPTDPDPAVSKVESDTTARP